MPNTTKGIIYPDQTGHTRLWEHLQTLASGIDPLLIGGVDVQAFTASGTWTKPANAILSYGRCVGGGGGGGGAPTTGVGEASVGAGGGSGVYAEVFIDAELLASTVPVTIGAGGAAGAATGNVAAGTGGTTSWGAVLSAAGGLGGIARNNSTTAFASVGGLGGTTGTGSIVIPGQTGQVAFASGQLGFSGVGGGSPFGAGGNAQRTTATGASTAGQAGIGYGSGGGGGICSGGMTGVLGGAGAPGYLIVYTLVG